MQRCTNGHVFPSAQAWLEHYAIPVPESGCWLFEGNTNKFGYGMLGMRRKMTIASRASYRMFKGPIAEGLCVCHTCDVPLCINPNHLFLGTRKENSEDMVRKGRSTKRERCKFGHRLSRPSWLDYGLCKICQRANKARYRANARQKKVREWVAMMIAL